MINVSTKYIKMLEAALSIEQNLDSATVNISDIVEQPDRLKYDIVLLKELITRIKTDRGKILESITNEDWDRY